MILDDGSKYSKESMMGFKMDEELQAKYDLLEEQRKTIGPIHLKSLVTQNEIAVLHLQRKQFTKAQQVLVDVVGKKSIILGPYHNETLIALIGIGFTYIGQNRLDDALRLFQAVYQIRLSVLGPDHVQTLNVQRNIGLFYHKQNRFEESMKILNEAHMESIKASNSLKEESESILREIGNWHPMQEKHEETLRIHDKLGKEIPKKFFIARALLDTDDEMGLNLFLKMYHRIQQEFGPDNRKTLTAELNIARAYADMKNFKMALQTHLYVFESCQELLGETDELTIDALHSLGLIVFSEENPVKGIRFVTLAHHRAKTTFGKDHKETLKIQHDLALLLRKDGILHESLSVYSDTYKLQIQKNPNDPDALKTQLLIADIHHELGNEIEAYKIYSKLHKRMGKNWPNIGERFSVWNGLAFSLSQQGNLKKSLKIYRELYEDKKRSFGSEDPRTLDTCQAIGELLVDLRKYRKALRLLGDLFARREKVLGVDHVQTLQTRQLMADLLALQENYDEAAYVYVEVFKVRTTLPFSMDEFYTLNNLSCVFCLVEEFDESIKVLKEGVANFPDKGDYTSTSKFCEGIAYSLLQDDPENDEIVNAFKTLSQVITNRLGPDHLATLYVKYSVAKLLQIQGKYNEALQIHEEIYKLPKKKKKLPSVGSKILNRIVEGFNMGNMYSYIASH